MAAKPFVIDETKPIVLPKGLCLERLWGVSPERFPLRKAK